MIKELLNISPYSLNKSKKEKIFLNKINDLTKFHYKNCTPYGKILKLLNFDPLKKYSLDKLPFIPSRLFKELDLISSNEKLPFRLLKSSGTSNNNLSKIYLDKENVNNQIKVLSKLFTSSFGKERLPMIVIASKARLNLSNSLDAKNAAIRGFSIFAKKQFFIEKNNGEIDYRAFNQFLRKYGKSKFLIFGFTSDVYNFLIEKLETKKLFQDLRNAHLLHGGGWKKMEEKKVDNKIFKKKLKEKLKIKNIFNYYGVVEQTGSIFIECRCGKLITSIFSEILIRNEKLEVLKNKKKGLVQLFSLLPSSYPGQSILTEDIGEIINEEGCKKCGLTGKSFIIHGRSKQAEVRGCSNI